MIKKGVIVQKQNVKAYNWGHRSKEVFLLKNFEREPEKIIGDARLYMEEDVIKADLMIFSNVKKLGKLYPAIGGRVIKRNESGVIIEAEITEVSLCVQPNVDPTIEPLSELP